jgi:uncharacterized protein
MPIHPAPSTLTSISVIVHDVRPEHQRDYERWTRTAVAAHQRFTGYLSTDIIRPQDAPHRYVVVIRFATDADATAWLVSTERTSLLQEAIPWLLQPERYRIDHGSVFWFQPQNGLEPRRWKQWVLSTAAVLPLMTLVPTAISIALRSVSLAPDGTAHGVLSAAVISALMVYWLVPWLTRWTARWLYR